MEVKNLDCAINELFDFITDTPSGLDGFESDFDAAFSELTKIKSDNVVEVVRCRECNHSHKGVDSDMTKEIWCTYWQKTEGKAWNLMRFNDFCSHGEKELGAEIK